MRAKLPTLLAALSVLGSSVNAEALPSGWRLEKAAGSCGVAQNFEGKGDTELSMLQQEAGPMAVSVINRNWSSVDGERYAMTVVVNGHSYSVKGVGIDLTSGKRGFLFTFDSEFRKDLVAGQSISFFLGHVLVDKLALDGSATALLAMDACMKETRAESATQEKERQRFADRPDDPFAGTSTAKLSPAPLRTIVTDDDYPPVALVARQAGRVEYELEVGANGRPQTCTITRSTSFEALDEATCRIVMRRALFPSDPRRPSTVKVEGSHDWHLPPDLISAP